MSPRVFISYAHEPDPSKHGERVLQLANRLRDEGIDVQLDQYLQVPEKGWQLWMEEEIEAADFVLVVARETYERRRRGREKLGEGKGVRWEGAIISQTLYDLRLENTKFIPVFFHPGDAEQIPIFLQATNRYHVATEEGYEDLYRRLTGQPAIERPKLGKVRKLPPTHPAAPSMTAPQIAIGHLPSTGEVFVAREDQLAQLDAAWGNEGTNVISFVAIGGAGKSALVSEWLNRMQTDGWRGAERVLGWSFYSQGTDVSTASSEPFSESALGWLGYEGEPITSPWKKGEVLAELLRERRTLLVLDGLEPLQFAPTPGEKTGRLKDPTVQALVKSLAAQNPGLCVITTRLPVDDLAGKAGAVSEDLEKLPPEAGTELLRRLGVEGKEKELQAASEDLAGHGLALTLLGTYLRDFCDGDVRRRGEVVLLDEEAIEDAAHARHVMEAYEARLGENELRVLQVLGLFDRPAEETALAAVRAEPEIPGLTEGIGAGEQRAWKAALARLRQARLVAPLDGNAGTVDGHPLVREYFGQRLWKQAPDAWRVGHGRLYDHYWNAAPNLPDTLEEMLPLYTAVVHGCRAGRVQEACDEVFFRRVRRQGEGYSLHKLGAFGSELTALAAFFDRPWDRPSDRLRRADQAWILGVAGFVLRALGRLREAVQPMQAGLQEKIEAEDWENAAISAGNLSELTLTLGDVESAVETGRQGVELADKSADEVQRLFRRTTLAYALHQAGRWEESAAAFQEAERMQVALWPQAPWLFSLRGFQYCDLLLARAEPEDGSGLDGLLVRLRAAAGSGRAGESDPATAEEAVSRYREACEEVRRRGHETIEIARSRSWLLDIALDHLSFGRAHLGLAVTSLNPDFQEAGEHLDRSVAGLREAGTQHHIPHGLLARAAFHRLTDSPDLAAADLTEALEIAERGSMRLHEADAHLEWCRLRLGTGGPAAARDHLDRARNLVRKTGYGRREREVGYLEGRLG